MNSDGIITVHTDGGSRGNPGPAASAFIIEDRNGVIYNGKKFLGKATNNFAEYTAVILAVGWLLEKQNINLSNILQINFILDSELVVKQINGLYKVKDETIKKLFGELNTKLKKLQVNTNFAHVRREQNKAADQLVNEELDSNI